jgi:beta-glucosidase
MDAIYKNSSQPTEARVDDLLSRMNLEEKIGQLMMADGRSELETDINERHVGAFLHILGDEANRAIDLSLQSRLGIPPLIAEDCIHGHSFWHGATIFPTQLALSCSWNPDLLRNVARVTAVEARPTGIHWTFSPVLCITRDLRWGRVGETFGEDVFLIGELGSAMIEGYQGKGLNDPEGMLATAKHFAGYCETQGGRDASEADLSRRKLRSCFFPPFEKAVRTECMTFMTGYQSMEGLPSTANPWLLKDVLKAEWGFKGIVVTDWDNVGAMYTKQKICSTMADAAALAVKSGNDLMMSTPGFFEGALEAIKRELLTEPEIDESCRRVLALKFKMGLFENPRRADLQKAKEVVAAPEHQALNLEAARQSVVLLRNSGILPLQTEGLKRIALIGPNADNDLEQLGDWSLGSSQHPSEMGKHPREATVTVLDGIRALAPNGCEILYTKGCAVRNRETDQIAEAVALARTADIVVVVLGDQLPFVGEFNSTATLELQGAQLELLEALSALGKPIVSILINSKPLVLPLSVQKSAAILEAFNPGMMGGQAIAEILFGVVNPSGKLTTSFPYHVGQQPIYYSQVRGQHGDRYADMPQAPLFAFGFGLSYTEFLFSNLKVLNPDISANDGVTIEVDITNIGLRHGVEIAQVYIEDDVTSATWVEKELKAFRRMTLKAGETQNATFHLAREAFSIVNAAGNRVIEPGNFKVHVGSSSRNCDLLTAVVHIPKTVSIK